jgi:hypothetical protein
LADTAADKEGLMVIAVLWLLLAGLVLLLLRAANDDKEDGIDGRGEGTETAAGDRCGQDRGQESSGRDRWPEQEYPADRGQSGGAEGPTGNGAEQHAVILNFTDDWDIIITISRM